MRGQGVAFVLVLTLASVGSLASSARAQLTLDDALRAARRANAALPVARLDAEGAAAAVDEARARRLPTVAFDGDLHTGFPERYASSDARAQIVAETPLYDGGRLRAAVEGSAAAADRARAGYHRSELDLDREVRVLFATCLEVDQELAFREAGVARLRSYQSVIEARHAGGQGVAFDLSQTRVRLGEEEANVADAERRRAAVALELNELMGQPLDAMLELAPLPAPELAAAQPAGQPWLGAPEIAQSEAEERAAAANVTAVRADRWPKVSLMVDGGGQPVWGNSNLALLNNGEGWGGELVLSVNMPLWDAGIQRSRVAQAELAQKAAKQRVSVTHRGVELAWQRAAADIRGLQREVEVRARTADTARDSYLQAESLYRGGAGSALEVLDAYDGWIAANQTFAEAVLRQRIAEAELVRWGTP